MHVKVNTRTVTKGNMPKLYKAPKKAEVKENPATDAVLVSMRTIQAAKCLQVGDVVICKKTVLPSHILVYFQSMLVGEIFHNLKTQTQEFRGVVVSVSNDEVLIELEQKPENDAQKQLRKAAEFVAEFAAAGNKGLLMTANLFNAALALVEEPNQVVTCKQNYSGSVHVFVGEAMVGRIILRPNAHVIDGTALSEDDIRRLPATFDAVVRQVCTADDEKPMMLLEANLQAENSKTSGKWNLLASYPKNRNLQVHVRNVVVCTKVNHQGTSTCDYDIDVTFGEESCGYISYKTEGNALQKDHIDSLPQQFLGVVVAIDDFLHIRVRDNFEVQTFEPEIDINNPTYTLISGHKLSIGVKLTAKRHYMSCDIGLYDGNENMGHICMSRHCAISGTIALEDAGSLPDTFDVEVVASGRSRLWKDAHYIVKPVMATVETANVNPQSEDKTQQFTKVEKEEKPATGIVRVTMNPHCLTMPRIGDVFVCAKDTRSFTDDIKVRFGNSDDFNAGVISYENNQEHLYYLKAQPPFFRGFVVSVSRNEVLIELEQKPEDEILKQFQKAAEFVAKFTATNKPQLMTVYLSEDSLALVKKPNQVVTCKYRRYMYVDVFVGDTNVGEIPLDPNAHIFDGTEITEDYIRDMPNTFNAVVRQVYTAKGMRPKMLLEVIPQAEKPKTSGKWNLIAHYSKERDLEVQVRDVVVCTKVNHSATNFYAPDIDVTFGGKSCGYIFNRTEGNVLHRDHIDSLPQQFLGVVVGIDDFLHIKVLNEFETPLTSEPEVDINNPTYTVLTSVNKDKLRVGLKLTAKRENWIGKNVFGLYHSGSQICQISRSKLISVPGTIAGNDAGNLPDTFDVVVVASGTTREGYYAYIVQPVMATAEPANLNPQSAAVPQQPAEVNVAKQPAAVEAKPKRYTVVAPIDTRLTIGMNLVAKKEEIPYAGGLGFDGSGIFNLFYGNQQVGTIASTKCMAVPNTEVVPIDKASDLPATFKVTVVDSGKTASGKFAFIVQEKKEE